VALGFADESETLLVRGENGFMANFGAEPTPAKWPIRMRAMIQSASAALGGA